METALVLALALLLSVLAAAMAWRVRPRAPKRRAGAPAIRTKSALDLEWYLDESTHTGDLVFKGSHVALVVMHPVSGEPWLLEADHRGGVQTQPARTLLDHEGELSVFTIGRPLSATKVLKAVSAAEAAGKLTCSQFAAHVLGQMGVLQQGTWRDATPHTLALQVNVSGQYDGPFDLE